MYSFNTFPCHIILCKGINNKINNGSVPFSCVSFGVLVLFTLALCHGLLGQVEIPAVKDLLISINSCL